MWHKFLNTTEQKVFTENPIDVPFLSQISFRSNMHLTLITKQVRSLYARCISAVYEHATKVNRTYCILG
jgi:hypothetical protein